MPPWIEPAEPDEPMAIQGPQGAAGNQGNPGAQGPVGAALYLEVPDIDEPMVIPGPQGNQGPVGQPGAQGPVGAALYLDATVDADEPPIMVPPDIPPFLGDVGSPKALSAVTTINDTVTYTTGGVTFAAPPILAGHVYRVRAYGNFVAVSSATSRNAQVACFWGATQLVAITVAVTVSVARTAAFELEFVLSGTSATAIWTTGYLLNEIAAASAATTYLVSVPTPASTTVTAGPQVLDLRFSMSVAVATDQWVIHQATIERLA